MRPEVRLLDEPFSAVHAMTHEMLQGELARLWVDPQRRQTTAILVTHDLDDAILRGDRIMVLGEWPGRVCLEVDVLIPRPLIPQDLHATASRRWVNLTVHPNHVRRPRCCSPAGSRRQNVADRAWPDRRRSGRRDCPGTLG